MVNVQTSEVDVKLVADQSVNDHDSLHADIYSNDEEHLIPPL
jgi:hypothetical protein